MWTNKYNRKYIKMACHKAIANKVLVYEEKEERKVTWTKPSDKSYHGAGWVIIRVDI